MRKIDNYVLSDDFYFHFLEASYFLKDNCCCKTMEISPVFADNSYGRNADDFYGNSLCKIKSKKTRIENK